MSNADDNTQAVSSDAPTESAVGPTILFFFLGLIAALAVGWGVFPQLLYSQKTQPFDFNHKFHVAQTGDCATCHSFRADGTFAGVPTIDRCLDCHDPSSGVPEGADKDETIFYRDYLTKYREVPWHVYARQPANVFFSHAAHVLKAKENCVECHGDIGSSTHLRPYEENRISGYSRDIWGYSISGIKTHPWDRMKMDDCSACHQKNHVDQDSAQTGKGACFVCHK